MSKRSDAGREGRHLGPVGADPNAPEGEPGPPGISEGVEGNVGPHVCVGEKVEISSNTLGFNLIVKNEENCLDRTLDSIRDIADEIVITDTGSTDGTVEIAKRYTDNVYFHEWQDSFSEARNHSLQFSTTDWVCSIDADEWLECDSVPELQSLLASNLNTVFCPIHSELPDGRIGRHFLPRLFRRGTAHYEGIVHNQLIHSQPTGITQVIRFGHSGYNEDAETMKRKRERTISLLRTQLEDAPDDTFALMNLARALHNHGEHNEALAIANQGLKLEINKSSIREMLIMTKLMILVESGENENAQHLVDEGLRINPSNVDFLFMRAKLAYDADDWLDVIIGLQAYQYQKQVQQQHHSPFSLTVYDFWDTGAVVHQMLAKAYHKLEQIVLARIEYRNALAIASYSPELWHGYFEVSNRLGLTKEAEAAQAEAQARGVRL